MNDQLKSAFGPINSIFAKHHSTIFACALFLMLAIAVYALYDVTNTANAPVSNSDSTISDFDRETINKIKELSDSSTLSNTLEFPSPRSSPFTE